MLGQPPAEAASWPPEMLAQHPSLSLVGRSLVLGSWGRAWAVSFWPGPGPHCGEVPKGSPSTCSCKEWVAGPRAAVTPRQGQQRAVAWTCCRRALDRQMGTPCLTVRPVNPVLWRTGHPTPVTVFPVLAWGCKHRVWGKGPVRGGVCRREVLKGLGGPTQDRLPGLCDAGAKASWGLTADEPIQGGGQGVRQVAWAWQD